MNPDAPKTPREEVELKLTALLLGELPAAESAALLELIRHDPELTALHGRLNQTMALVRETSASPAAETMPQAAPLKLSDDRRQKLLAHFKTVQLKERVPQRRRFEITLLEVAVVLAILAILAAMMLPALTTAKDRAKSVAVLSNIRMVESAKAQWASDHDAPNNAEPTIKDLEPYFGRGDSNIRSVSGETYVPGKVGERVAIEVDAKAGRFFRKLPAEQVIVRGEEPLALAFTPPSVNSAAPVPRGKGEEAAGGPTKRYSYSALATALTESSPAPSTPIVLPSIGQSGGQNGDGMSLGTVAAGDFLAGDGFSRPERLKVETSLRGFYTDSINESGTAPGSGGNALYFSIEQSGKKPESPGSPKESLNFFESQPAPGFVAGSQVANNGSSVTHSLGLQPTMDPATGLPMSESESLDRRGRVNSQNTGDYSRQANVGLAEGSVQQESSAQIKALISNNRWDYGALQLKESLAENRAGAGGFGGGGGGGGGLGSNKRLVQVDDAWNGSVDGAPALGGGGMGGGGAGGGFGNNRTFVPPTTVPAAPANSGRLTLSAGNIVVPAQQQEFAGFDLPTDGRIAGQNGWFGGQGPSEQPQNRNGKYQLTAEISGPTAGSSSRKVNVTEMEEIPPGAQDLFGVNAGKPAELAKDKSEIPLLGDMPAMGHAFRFSSTKDTDADGRSLNELTKNSSDLQDSVTLQKREVALRDGEDQNQITSGIRALSDLTYSPRPPVTASSPARGVTSLSTIELPTLTEDAGSEKIRRNVVNDPLIQRIQQNASAPIGRASASNVHSLEIVGYANVPAQVTNSISIAGGLTLGGDVPARETERSLELLNRPTDAKDSLADNVTYNQARQRLAQLTQQQEALGQKITSQKTDVATGTPATDAASRRRGGGGRGGARAEGRPAVNGQLQALEADYENQKRAVALAQQVVDRLESEAKATQNLTDAPPAKPATPLPVPQPETQTRENAFSTFSLNVSDVSFKLAAASLENGALPEPGSIRSEEFINAFDYRDPEASPGSPIAFTSERARYPFAYNRDLLRFSVKTAAAGRQEGRAMNIVLLLDNSGSMERADRVGIIREAMRVLAGQLQPQDKLSVVTFSRTPRLWVDGLAGNQAAAVADGLGELAPEGGTNLEEAMNLAYATAARHYLAGGINRVVLLTDGAANLGNVEPAALKLKVEANRKQGIALDCFGIGWDGYNDDLLEVLSRNGDGRYGFINSPEEAATEFVSQLAGALQVAASDVKVQVEFNPKRVTSYRQIGYAKHQLTKEQFRDNTVDAAEIAAQEAGNALYTVEVNPAGQGPVATVRVRYKVPGTATYREQEWAVPYAGNVVSLEQASPAMRLAATASAFSEWLATSPFAGEVTPDALLRQLSGVPEVYGADARPKKLEWMIRQAKSLSGK